MPALRCLAAAALLCASPVLAQEPLVRPAADAGKLALEVGRGRPVVLHFWATWCGACSGEFARLHTYLNALPGRGVAVALVSIDGPESRAAVPEALRGFGVGELPSILLDAPSPEPVAAALGEARWDGTLPATFVFDARGNKLAAFVGTVTEAQLAKALPVSAGKRRPARPKG